MRATYEVRAIRSGRWWTLEAADVPRARSQTRRLDQAEVMIREALAMVLDVEPDSFDVAIHPVLEPELDELVSNAVKSATVSPPCPRTNAGAGSLCLFGRSGGWGRSVMSRQRRRRLSPAWLRAECGRFCR
jgi:hypothetical protein